LGKSGSSWANSAAIFKVVEVVAEYLNPPVSVKIPRNKQMAASVQRAAMVLVHVCVEFMEMIMKGCRLCREKLICKLKTLEREIFDPNYKRRETSLKRVARLAEEYA